MSRPQVVAVIAIGTRPMVFTADGHVYVGLNLQVYQKEKEWVTSGEWVEIPPIPERVEGKAAPEFGEPPKARVVSWHV